MSKISNAESYINRIKDAEVKNALKEICAAVKDLERELKNLRNNVKYDD